MTDILGRLGLDSSGVPADVITTAMSDDPHRLPGHVRPRHYRLELDTDLETATFRGLARIDLDVLLPTDRIVCNAAELQLDDAVLEVDGDRIPCPATLDPSLERVTFALPRPLDPGPARLEVHFRGTLNDQLRGFYRSSYRDDQGRPVPLAVTQFQSTDARRAFPCWDEPELKATFTVSLTVDPGLLAIANTGMVADEVLASGRRRVTFARTMPMSTYLVAFVVGALEATEARIVDGVPIRVVHRPGRGHLADYALDVAAHALRYFTGYYGIPYPGDKLDLVAIPDFASGAMENLGCITFREVLLLVDPERTPQPERQEVADVVNHEIAHMWFGDLVTMRWWNGLWLNEAFATFMEIAATEAFRPDWAPWTGFSLGRSAAFDVDALDSTRPVEYPVATPAEADDMFDVLTYQKGASVLRMLEQYLGPEAFRDGIRRYLADHAYASTDTHDLWNALEAETGAPVRRIMSSWIPQPGYPVLELDATDSALRVRQARFRYPADGQGADDVHWLVPLRIRCTDGTTVTHLLDADEATIPLPAAPVTANADAAGFYRLQWSHERLEAIIDTGPAIAAASPLERYALLDDTHAMVLAGRLPAPVLLQLLGAFGDEDDLAVWQRMAAVLRAVAHVLPDTADADLGRLVAALTAPTLERLGPLPHPNEADRTRQVRGLLVGLRGVFQPTTDRLEQARSLLDEHAADPALRAAAVSILAASADPATWADLRRRAERAQTPQDVERFQLALADAPLAELVERACHLAVTTEIRTQDAPYLLRAAMANRRHGRVAWSVVSNRWEELLARLSPATIPRMLDGVRWLSSPDVAVSVETFLDTHPVPLGHRQVRQHLERLRVNTAFRSREAAALTTWLHDFALQEG